MILNERNHTVQDFIMSEYDRTKYGKKKFHQTRESPNSFGRTFGGNRSDTTPSKGLDTTPKKQPTILIKAREPTSEDALSKLSQKEETKTNLHSTKESDAPLSSSVKQMTKSMKLIDDNVMCTDQLQDYLQDNTEFLVVGIIGAQSVGKSTIANLLIHNEITEEIKKELFKSEKSTEAEYGTDSENVKLLTDKLSNVDIKKDENIKKAKVFQVENTDDLENGSHRTQGVDMFITNNRLILLDCQPFISLSVLEELIKYENKRTNLVSEFIPLESSGEIQGLQLATFLMSVCHVLIVVQDYFFDGNIMRFIQSAEMLKPTIPNPEEEVSDHFPHLLFIQNKAQMSDFSPSNFKKMQQTYRMLFKKSKINIKSGLGLGTGRLVNYLNIENCGTPTNLFLIPEIDLDKNPIFYGHPPLCDLVKRLRTNILGATRNLLTHVQLSEKMWLIYCSKVWETVKKSSFFVEYMKLMP